MTETLDYLTKQRGFSSLVEREGNTAGAGLLYDEEFTLGDEKLEVTIERVKTTEAQTGAPAAPAEPAAAALLATALPSEATSATSQGPSEVFTVKEAALRSWGLGVAASAPVVKQQDAAWQP